MKRTATRRFGGARSVKVVAHHRILQGLAFARGGAVPLLEWPCDLFPFSMQGAAKIPYRVSMECPAERKAAGSPPPKTPAQRGTQNLERRSASRSRSCSRSSQYARERGRAWLRSCTSDGRLVGRHRRPALRAGRDGWGLPVQVDVRAHQCDGRRVEYRRIPSSSSGRRSMPLGMAVSWLKM